MKIQYILLLIILFSYIKTDNEKYDIDDFKQSIWFWKSKSEGTYEINTGLDNKYKIISYLNNYDEKYTKLIIYEKTEESYQFSLASYKKSKNYYIKDEEKNIFSINQIDYEIHNVIGNVFNNDNKICYLVSLYKHDSTGNSDNHFNFLNYLFYPNENNIYEMTDTNIKGKVFVADIDGDKKLEIIYDNETNGTRQVMKIDSNYKNNHTINSFTDYIIQDSNYPNYNGDKLSLEGSNAFIDINNDCRNDLILSVDSENGPKLLIYIGMYYKLNDHDDTYVIKYGLNQENEINLDKDFGPFALGDFNDDGRVDLIFPSLTGNKVSILLNEESRKNDWSDEFCPHHKIKDQSNTLFNLSDSKYCINLTFPESDEKKIYYNPKITYTSIRTADFMSSGFHGILVIMEDINNGEQSVRLYKIDKDDDKLNLELEIDLSKKFSNLNQNLQYASFFDFGEDGILDVIVVGDDETRGFYRNVDNSNYYVTAQLSVTDNDKKYNLIEVGAGYHYVVTNNNGKRRIDYSWQLAQTGDLNLNLNYAYMGLGRTNNYLENLEIVSVSSKKINNDTKSDSVKFTDKDLTEYKQYTPIIPKSQLLVKKVGDDWNIDLIVQPTEKIILMIVIIFIILLIILAIIIYLHIKEVKEDKNQAKEFSAWYS